MIIICTDYLSLIKGKDNMPFSTLVRDKDKILNAIAELPDGSLIAKEPMEIILPCRYEEAMLTHITQDVYTLGIFALKVGNHYAVNNIPARIRLHPVEIDKVKYKDNDYYVLSFEKGSTITDNINVVKENTLGYYIYNYFIALGKIPWFMSAMDVLGLFDRMLEYTNVNYGASIMIPEMICSMIMRDQNDIQQYWRQSINRVDELYSNIPDYIPLRNVPFGARNTTAKLMGAYFNEGINSALLYPSETTESVEALLRQ